MKYFGIVSDSFHHILNIIEQVSLKRKRAPIVTERAGGNSALNCSPPPHLLPGIIPCIEAGHGLVLVPYWGVDCSPLEGCCQYHFGHD